MIIERRAYTLKAGTAPLFWKAQLEWNATGPYADVLAIHNLAYFESVAGPCDQILELHRYESLDQWKALAEHVYKTSTGEYFARIRPLLLYQENGFYLPAPIEELKPSWTGGKMSSPQGFERHAFADPSDICAVETILDLQPGGPPVYWGAYRHFVAAEPEIAQHHLVGAYSSIIGVLHRVVHHRWFADFGQAHAYKRRLEENENWMKFAETYRPWVVHDHSSYLRVSPVPWLRSVFDPGRSSKLIAASF